MQIHANDHLNADVRDMEAARACFSEQCVNAQLDGPPREDDPLMQASDERLVDWGMSTDRPQ